MEKYTITINDLIEQCKAHMETNGLPISEEILIDGNVHRYSTDSNKHKRDEWYIAFGGVSIEGVSYLNCIYGSWSTGVQYTFKSFEESLIYDGESPVLNQLWREHQKKASITLVEQRNQAAKEAALKWETYSTELPGEEYLIYPKSKGIEPIGVRFGLNPQGFPSLVVPIKNVNGEMRSLQYISQGVDTRSYKTFLTGGEKKGNFHVIGCIEENSLLYMVEGYATGISVYEATKRPVIIAFDAGNIKPVVENLHKKYPHKIVIIAGDNDEAGKRAALEALPYGKCIPVFPVFPAQLKGYTDFNDLHQHCGIDEVAKQLANHNGIRLIQFDEDSKENPCHQFRLSKLPQSLGAYISMLSKTTNAHPIMITASVLGMVSGFLRKKVYIPDASDGYYQDLYANLWMIGVAKSGQFKTTALNKGAKYAYDNQSAVLRDIKLLKDEYEKAVDNDSKEYIVTEIAKRSLDNVILPTKITAEGFIAYLSEGHGGVIYTSEFGAVLQNFDKSHNNDFKATMTEFFDVPGYYRYKTKTQGDFIIERPYLSICGVSTLPWIRENLKTSDVSSGFFARFLIYAPPYDDAIPPALPQPIDCRAEQAEQAFTETFVNILKQVKDGKMYRLTDEAKILFERLHIAIYMIPAAYTDHAKDVIDPYLKRWSPYLLKLAMIMQLFIDPVRDEISCEAICAAWNVLLPAIKSTLVLFDGELGESNHQRQCRKVYNWLLKKSQETGEPIKRSALLSSKQLEGGSKQYDDILQTLTEQGRLHVKEAKNKSDCEYLVVEHSSDT